MNSKFLFSNLPPPLFIKEGILSSFHYWIYVFPFSKGRYDSQLRGYRGITEHNFQLLHERTKIIIEQVSRH